MSNFNDEKVKERKLKDDLIFLVISILYFIYFTKFVISGNHPDDLSKTANIFFGVFIVLIPFVAYTFYSLANITEVTTLRFIFYPLIVFNLFVGLAMTCALICTPMLIVFWVLYFVLIPVLIVLFLVGLTEDLKKNKK